MIRRISFGVATILIIIVILILLFRPDTAGGWTMGLLLVAIALGATGSGNRQGGNNGYSPKACIYSCFRSIIYRCIYLRIFITR